jgi:hypothetical protein
MSIALNLTTIVQASFKDKLWQQANEIVQRNSSIDPKPFMLPSDSSHLSCSANPHSIEYIQSLFEETIQNFSKNQPGEIEIIQIPEENDQSKGNIIIALDIYNRAVRQAIIATSLYNDQIDFDYREEKMEYSKINIFKHKNYVKLNIFPIYIWCSRKYF